jgi:hypothetical protein
MPHRKKPAPVAVGMKPRGTTREQGSWYVIQAGGSLMLNPKVAT